MTLPLMIFPTSKLCQFRSKCNWCANQANRWKMFTLTVFLRYWFIIASSAFWISFYNVKTCLVSIGSFLFIEFRIKLSRYHYDKRLIIESNYFCLLRENKIKIDNKTIFQGLSGDWDGWEENSSRRNPAWLCKNIMDQVRRSMWSRYRNNFSNWRLHEKLFSLYSGTILWILCRYVCRLSSLEKNFVLLTSIFFSFRQPHC